MTATADKRDHHWAMFAAGVVVVVVGLLLWLAAGTLFLIFSGLLLAVFLCGLTDLASRRLHLRRGFALTIVCLALVALLGLMGWSMASRVAEQAQEFNRKLPEAVKSLRAKLNQYPWGRWAADELKGLRSQAEDTEKTIERAASAASAALDSLTGMVVVVFLGVFIAVDPELYKRSLVRLVPKARRERARDTIDSAGSALWRWTLGRLLSMAFVALAATIGFWLIGMPLALILGLFAGLMNFIPNLGPLIWLAPAMLLAFTQSPAHALYVGILFMVVQSVEGYLITPLVQQRMVHLAPAIALSVQVIFGALWGFPGLALATPMAAMALAIIDKLYVEDVLGDDAAARA